MSENKRKLKWPHKKVAVVALCAATVVVLAAVFGTSIVRNNSKDENPANNQQVTIEGELGCVPHKGSGPITLECAVGILTDDGTYYNLDLTAVNFPTGNFGGRLRVTGTFQTKEDTPYDSKGVVVVDSYEEQ